MGEPYGTHRDDVSLLTTLIVIEKNMSCSRCNFLTKSLVMSTIQENTRLIHASDSVFCFRLPKKITYISLQITQPGTP